MLAAGSCEACEVIAGPAAAAIIPKYAADSNSVTVSTVGRRPLVDICRIRLVRMTAPLERVFRVFLDDPVASRYGYDLMKAAALSSGTLYPLLARLEARALVASAWETPRRDGERPRRYYRLTSEGIEVARLELAQLQARRRRAPGRQVRPAPADAR